MVRLQDDIIQIRLSITDVFDNESQFFDKSSTLIKHPFIQNKSGITSQLN